MHNLEEIADNIHRSFDACTKARDQALARTRIITRHCAHAIRAIHRDEYETARDNLSKAHELVLTLQRDLSEYPSLHYAGYAQDAFKEYAEANIVFALVNNNDLPTPETLMIDAAPYLGGLAEATGELRRRCLDHLRHGNSSEAELLLNHMDDIYAILITMDYPDAVTGGLRRLTDIVRSVTERTRGDLTVSLRQEQLEQNLRRLEKRLSELGG